MGSCTPQAVLAVQVACLLYLPLLAFITLKEPSKPIPPPPHLNLNSSYLEMPGVEDLYYPTIPSTSWTMYDIMRRAKSGRQVAGLGGPVRSGLSWQTHSMTKVEPLNRFPKWTFDYIFVGLP